MAERARLKSDALSSEEVWFVSRGPGVVKARLAPVKQGWATTARTVSLADARLRHAAHNDKTKGR